MTDSDGNNIQINDKVVLRKENIIQIAEIQKSKKVNVDKQWFSLMGAIGHPYGTTFVADGNKIHPVDETTEVHNLKDEETSQRKDNRDINDSSDSQKLSREEIEELRKQGEKGEEVIRQLIENSSTFDKKTEYAQEKYIKKKTKKHINKFTIIRPCTRVIAEMYYNKGPAKINFLRMDALAQMMTYGDVKANIRQLVVESCNGLLLAATMERMGGHGVLVQLHAEQDPPRQALEGFNFTSDHYKTLHHLPLRYLGNVKRVEVPATSDQSESEATPNKRPRLDEVNETKKEIDNQTEVENMKVDEPSKQNGAETETYPKTEVDTPDSLDDDTAVQKSILSEQGSHEEKSNSDSTEKSAAKAELERRKLLRQQKIDATQEILQEGNFDSLLVATRVHPTPIVLRLLELLADSRPVVVFSPYQEPLIDCYQRLRDTGRVVHLRLSETWLRNYQVLPDRTHPEINMSMNGGYLLTFIKVNDQPVPTSTG